MKLTTKVGTFFPARCGEINLLLFMGIGTKEDEEAEKKARIAGQTRQDSDGLITL